MEVEITYRGDVFRIHKYKNVSTPFEYEFEDDGDVNITIDGKTYDVDSPYDIERKKKRTLKTKKKKKKPNHKKKTAKKKKKKQSKSTNTKK